MKATIEENNGMYLIRISGEEGTLCDIHVVEELELRGQYQDSDEFVQEQSG